MPDSNPIVDTGFSQALAQGMHLGLARAQFERQMQYQQAREGQWHQLDMLRQQGLNESNRHHMAGEDRAQAAADAKDQADSRDREALASNLSTSTGPDGAQVSDPATHQQYAPMDVGTLRQMAVHKMVSDAATEKAHRTAQAILQSGLPPSEQRTAIMDAFDKAGVMPPAGVMQQLLTPHMPKPSADPAQREQAWQALMGQVDPAKADPSQLAVAKFQFMQTGHVPGSVWLHTFGDANEAAKAGKANAKIYLATTEHDLGRAHQDLRNAQAMGGDVATAQAAYGAALQVRNAALQHHYSAFAAQAQGPQGQPQAPPVGPAPAQVPPMGQPPAQGQPQDLGQDFRGPAAAGGVAPIQIPDAMAPQVSQWIQEAKAMPGATRETIKAYVQQKLQGAPQ